MRVAIAHDYLTQRGGAERVALELAKAFPGAPFYTSVFDSASTFEEFASIDVRTSWLQRIRAIRRDPRIGLPMMPRAWEGFTVRDVDVVIASSTGFSHGIRVPSDCRKIIYCHNPPRWLYQPNDYLEGRHQRAALSVLSKKLTAWDKRAASSADLYVANSTEVAKRIMSAYGIAAEILHPPVLVDPAGPLEPVEGLEPGFWLSIARGRGYKNTQVVADGVSQLPAGRLVVAGSASASIVGPHVTALGIVSDAQLRWLYANARALVSVSFEDFGLTPLEANAFGTPVAVLRAGGFLDSTHENVSGVFIESATSSAVSAALKRFPVLSPDAIRKHAAKFSAAAFTERIRELAQASQAPLSDAHHSAPKSDLI